MSGYDPLEDLSKAQIEALVGSLMGKQTTSVGITDPGKTKLRRRSLGRVKRVQRDILDPIPGAGLNQTIEITVRLPAYLVAGIKAEGDLDTGIRLAVRDWLISRGKTWWYPRFLAATVVKRIEAHFDASGRFTTSKPKIFGEDM